MDALLSLFDGDALSPPLPPPPPPPPPTTTKQNAKPPPPLTNHRQTTKAPVAKTNVNRASRPPPLPSPPIPRQKNSHPAPSTFASSFGPTPTSISTPTKPQSKSQPKSKQAHLDPCETHLLLRVTNPLIPPSALQSQLTDSNQTYLNYNQLVTRDLKVYTSDGSSSGIKSLNITTSMLIHTVSETIMSRNGKAFKSLTCGLLSSSLTTVLLLFSEAYSEYSSLKVGSVIVVTNPGLMPAAERGSNNVVVTLSINKGDQLKVVGMSTDYNTCKGHVKSWNKSNYNGGGSSSGSGSTLVKCKNVVDKRGSQMTGCYNGYCKDHLNQIINPLKSSSSAIKKKNNTMENQIKQAMINSIKGTSGLGLIRNVVNDSNLMFGKNAVLAARGGLNANVSANANANSGRNSILNASRIVSNPYAVSNSNSNGNSNGVSQNNAILNSTKPPPQPQSVNNIDSNNSNKRKPSSNQKEDSIDVLGQALSQSLPTQKHTSTKKSKSNTSTTAAQERKMTQQFDANNKINSTPSTYSGTVPIPLGSQSSIKPVNTNFILYSEAQKRESEKGRSEDVVRGEQRRVLEVLKLKKMNERNGNGGNSILNLYASSKPVVKHAPKPANKVQENNKFGLSFNSITPSFSKSAFNAASIDEKLALQRGRMNELQNEENRSIHNANKRYGKDKKDDDSDRVIVTKWLCTVCFPFGGDGMVHKSKECLSRNHKYVKVKSINQINADSNGGKGKNGNETMGRKNKGVTEDDGLYLGTGIEWQGNSAKYFKE